MNLPRRPLCALCLGLATLLPAAEGTFPLAGADETTPSRAQYFSWINNTNEGSTEAQTLTNLAFFRWLRDEYGMRLDIYAWDAGNLDGAGGYGTMTSERFRANYPRGWKPVADATAAMDCRLGLWGGPDGFGDTAGSAAARIELMSGLCRDYRMALFKFDGVCGQLRPQKQDEFIAMMQACRRHSPDLILLNHRLPLGKGIAHATTFLWEGAETYIDVHMANTVTAPHHRACALARGLPPRLTRLTEDHGVCISSCLDGWDDDLVLQAFNRSLILAPEIYGNPWLLRDDEFPRLARIYNLHRRYGAILIHGMPLPADGYGPHAVARGDAGTRLVTLRNLGWEPVTYRVRLDGAIGLTDTGPVEMRRLHPYERVLGRFAHGAEVAVEVAPFRSCLLLACVKPIDDIGVAGCDAEVTRDVPGKPVVVTLRGLPGSSATATLHPGSRTFTQATVEGRPLAGFAEGKPVAMTFPGTPLTLPCHRRLADFTAGPVPADAEALYEATCFAADNDALEVRSLARSGPTRIPIVQQARDAFFAQDLFRSRGCQDRLLFDGDPTTAFANTPDPFRGSKPPVPPGAMLRLDLGTAVPVDRIVMQMQADVPHGTVAVSADLISWQAAKTTRDGLTLVVEPTTSTAIRYLRMPRGALALSEVTATCDGKPLSRTGWRASNLFPAYADRPATAAWQTAITLPEAAPGSCLCVALDGIHGADGAWVAARLDGRPLGCPDRAPSFASNVWEHFVKSPDRNTTWYLPVTRDMVGRTIDLVVMTLHGGKDGYRPSVWLTAREPEAAITVQLDTGR